MAESVKKGARITGTARDKLAADLRQAEETSSSEEPEGETTRPEQVLEVPTQDQT